MSDRRDRPRRGDIHLGDLTRALGSLDWQGEAQAAAIAASLGFGLDFGLGAQPVRKPPVEIYERPRQRTKPATRPSPRRAPPVSMPLPPETPPVLPANVVPSYQEELPELAPAAPDADWPEADEHRLDPAFERSCARETLFPERTSRHIVAAALATRRSGEQIDVARLIAAAARRHVLRELPRQPEPTLARGCQLLLDHSATMVPFWQDLTDLIDQVGAVVGAANVRDYRFDTRPTQAARWTPTGRREPWEPDGRPVLAASDLGIQGAGAESAARVEPDPAWNLLAERCAGAASPLLILVPWPEHRWPKTLAGQPELIHWSPHTTVGMIRRCVGAGHRTR